MIIINRLNGIQRCHNSIFFPFIEEVINIKAQFDFLTLEHFYREMNHLVDHLSKEGS